MADQLAQRGLGQAVPRPGRTKTLDLRSPVLDDASVRNTRRAHGLARAAAEAQVDVTRLLLREGKLLALPLRHQVDAAARGLGLEAADSKRRARVQAQPAMHARGEVVVAEALERLQNKNLPGFNTWSGSNASLSRRIISSVSGGVPQAPACLLMSSGAANSTSEPPAASAADRAAARSSPLSKLQCAIPTPGDAHQVDLAGSDSSTPRSAARG